jgi:hypothetical protein
MTRATARAGAAVAVIGILAASLMLGTSAAYSQGRHTGAVQSAGRHASGGPAAPVVPVLAYYYIWFNVHSWKRAKIDYPLVGRYSSDDPTVMQKQIKEAKSAGINGFIVSWKDTRTDDRRLRLLMAVARHEHFKLAMIYEGLDFYRHPLPVTVVAAAFEMFKNDFASDPVFYRLGGKPLTIWSGTWDYSHADVARVTTAVRGSMLVLSTEKNVKGFMRLADVTDGDAYYWSSVNPLTNTNYAAKLGEMSKVIHHDRKYWIAPFAPGFDARLVGGHTVVRRGGGQTLRTEYATAVRSSPDALGLISWNEFSENSYVEPSRRYGAQSLAVLRSLRGTPVPMPPSAADSSAPNGRPAASIWPNVLRLSGFVVALVLAVGLIGLLRRVALKRSLSTPSAKHSGHSQDLR